MKLKTVAGIASFILVACASNDIAISPADGVLNKPAVGKEDQSVIYQVSSDENLDIHIQKIEEARCPSDVQCIWQGYVKVAFQVDDVSEVELITPQFAGSNASENYEFTSGGRNYRLTLKNVVPYPSTKNYEETKSVEFILESL
jgi:hypothetical protein